jgi:sulfur-oxidizing protein SoxY
MFNRRTAMQRAGQALALKWLPLGLTAWAAGTAHAAWPAAAFEATATADALKQLFPALKPHASDAVQISAPEIAENGAVVPVTVTTTLPGAKTITLLADGNPRALLAQHTFGPRSSGPVTVRIRLAKTQNIVAALATADGQLLTSSRQIKVTLGGCGG